MMTEGSMRTTVTVGDDVAEDLMALTSARTRTEAVNQALKDWVRWKKIDRLRSLRGKLTIDGDWESLRAAEVDEARETHGRRPR
jgi:Arc/MetJ family transcription regulator